jgi:hypothetical protein
VIVDDFDIDRAGVSPLKTDPILIVDADGMLSRTVAFQRFEPVTRREPYPSISELGA